MRQLGAITTPLLEAVRPFPRGVPRGSFDFLVAGSSAGIAVSQNRKAEDIIVAQLGSAAENIEAKPSLFEAAAAYVGEREWSREGDIYGLATPAAWVARGLKPEAGWMAVDAIKWRVCPLLPGVGTAAAACFVWHKDALCYEWEWDKYGVGLCRHAADLVNPAAVVRIIHNDMAHMRGAA